MPYRGVISEVLEDKEIGYLSAAEFKAYREWVACLCANWAHLQVLGTARVCSQERRCSGRGGQGGCPGHSLDGKSDSCLIVPAPS